MKPKIGTFEYTYTELEEMNIPEKIQVWLFGAPIAALRAAAPNLTAKTWASVENIMEMINSD